MKDLYSKNYKALMKVIGNNTNKWKCIPCSLVRRNNIIKMSILPIAIYKFNIIHIKPIAFFTELEQIVLTFIWNHKRSWTAKAILREKNKDTDITMSDHTSTVLAQKYIHGSTEQFRNTKNKPTFVWLINQHERRQEYTMGERQFLQWMLFRKLDSYLKNNATERLSYIKLKMDKDLYVRSDTKKIREENIGSNLLDKGLNHVIMDMCPQEKVTKAKIKYWDYIKLKTWTPKETFN